MNTKIDIKFDLSDILIEPSITSPINSRKEILLVDENGFLPLFASPMNTVVSDENFSLFIENRIIPILPRRKYKSSDFCLNFNKWTALSLEQLKVFINNYHSKPIRRKNQKFYICLDIANGHLECAIELSRKAKELFQNNLVLMVGNIANPETFFIWKDIADFVRCGIGFGNGCLTSVQTGIGYPIGSLIYEINTEKITRFKPHELENFYPKIIADGGVKNYSDIIKLLALGADYVMCGSIFNKALESAGQTIRANIKHQEGWTEPGDIVNQFSSEIKQAFLAGAKFNKKFSGMSSKEVQLELGNTEVKTSEAIVKIQSVEYTLSGWIENFMHYLSSAMSYVGSRNLKEFIGKVNFNLITQNSFNRFNK